MLNPMHILVPHGSRHGGTEGLARAVGEALADAGHTVEVRPANEPDGLDAWDAVIVGGALYANRCGSIAVPCGPSTTGSPSLQNSNFDKYVKKGFGKLVILR